MGKYDMDLGRIRLRDCVSPDFNPRVIGDDEFESLKESIRRFGYSDPIIVNRRNNHIVAGNQRYRALCDLNRENHGKYTEIECVFVDLDLADEKAFNIGHNKIGGTFDEDKLRVLLEELDDVDYDLSLTGFDDELDDVDLESLVDDDLGDVEGALDAHSVYMVSVRCVDVAQQQHVFEKLKAMGLDVKATTY